jgi:hypothetical protein
MLDMNGWEPLQAYKRQTSHYSTLRNVRSMDKQGKKFLVPGFIVSLYDRPPGANVCDICDDKRAPRREATLFLGCDVP